MQREYHLTEQEIQDARETIYGDIDTILATYAATTTEEK